MTVLGTPKIILEYLGKLGSNDELSLDELSKNWLPY